MGRIKNRKNKLHPGQVDEIQQAIIKYRRENHLSPSIRELAYMTGKSSTTVFYYINYLDSIHWLMPRKQGAVRSFVPMSELEMTDANSTPAQPDPQV